MANPFAFSSVQLILIFRKVLTANYLPQIIFDVNQSRNCLKTNIQSNEKNNLYLHLPRILPKFIGTKCPKTRV